MDPAEQHQGWAMRQFCINSALLALALAPLVFDLCASLITGGSFANALNRSNLWIFPFLIASGTILFIKEFRELKKQRDREIANRPFNGLRTAMPEVEKKIKVIARRALPSGSAPTFAVGTSHDADRYDPPPQPPPEATPETIEGLVAEIWAGPDGDIKPPAYRAAWRLAALMTSTNARAGIRRLQLSADRLSQPYLKWLVRPEEAPAGGQDSLSVVQGRIGYLLRASGTNYLPPPPLVVDQYIAIGLIVVRESNAPYHSRCRFELHASSGDSDGTNVLNLLYEASRPKHDSSDGSDPSARFNSYLDNLTYYDIGRLIRPDLLHTRPSVANKQAELIRHVMRHFFTDDLSAVLFDALPDETQAHLAASLLTASKWMSPSAWERWIKTGRNMVYAPKLEVASDTSFAAAGGLAVGVLTLACWEIAAWISEGWSWYFGKSHFLVTAPGWFKVVVIIAAIVAAVMALSRLYPIGAMLGITAAISVAIAILASPIVRVHTWISSWAASSTVIVATLICATLLAWLGIFYADRRYTEKPVQFVGLRKSRIQRVERRSRYLPGHDVGHEVWCLTESL